MKVLAGLQWSEIVLCEVGSGEVWVDSFCSDIFLAIYRCLEMVHDRIEILNKWVSALVALYPMCLGPNRRCLQLL